MTTNQHPVHSNHVTTEGDTLYYEVRGQGLPFILIPGAGGDADRYAEVADILADEFKVITYDRRANSRSTINEPQNFEISQQSRDVVAVLHASGEQSAFTFGNSSGGVIALDVAKTQPQAVRAVIVHEPPLSRIHPDSKKWQRFYASVYSSAFRWGSTVAVLRFLFGTGLPVRQMLSARKDSKERLQPTQEARISPKVTTDVLMKLELLPVTNYMPDIETIKRNKVKVIMAAGQESLDKKRWYAQTVPILADKLGCEMVILPGHHASFISTPVEWAAALRTILHKAAES